MKPLTYFLIGLTIIKIVLDIFDREQLAKFSFFLENVIFLIFFYIVIRTHFKQKMGEKEKLAKDLESLSQKIESLEDNGKQ